MKTVVVLAAAAFALSAGAANLNAQDAAKVAAGKKVYETQKCATCHAIGGTGGKLASALDGVGKKLTEADIKKWLTNPAEMETKLKAKPKMPMSTWLKTHKQTDADVEALVAYMLSLK
ncbi:MAG TPA: cytochrome c [Vicinamibacterales bacterium]|nr:cytochrome c [Vicinamibacterales bacterium]